MNAALLYAGEGSVLSHWTAAQIWNFRIDKHDEIHITMPQEHQVTSVPGRLVAHRSGHLTAAVQRTKNDQPLTSVERTAIDLACCITGRNDIRALAADVVQRGITTPRRLATELARRPSLPGVGTLGEVLVAVGDGARSVLEIELRARLLASTLPAALANKSVAGASGRVYWVDNLWPDARLIVEVDGREWHLSPERWEHDLDRMADLTAAGFTLVRFTANAIRRRTQRTLDLIATHLAR
ncbi:MAG: DUF559 domain-containing protein [Actinomycetota bacterium]